MGTSAKARKRVGGIAGLGAKQNITYNACLDLLISCVSVETFLDLDSDQIFSQRKDRFI